MSWLSRLLTLPKSRNSFKDVIGLEMWQRFDRDVDNAMSFLRACEAYVQTHQGDAVRFSRALIAMLLDSARMVQQGLDTQDPFQLVRANVRQFARTWRLDWNG